MGKYLELMAGAGAEVYAIIGVFVIALIASVMVGILRARHRSSEPDLPRVPVEKQIDETPKPKQVESILGKGQYKCMCFRLGNIVNFTTIPAPIGELYQFDPSCPFSGAGYIVKESEDGKVKNYDPREVIVKIEQSPEYAWFATHWDIVRVVFSVPLQWWKSPATWFAVGMMLIVFISGLVVFD